MHETRFELTVSNFWRKCSRVRFNSHRVLLLAFPRLVSFFFLWVQIFSNVRTLSAIGICVPVVVVSFPSLLSCSTYLLLSWEMQFDSRINPWVFGVHADCVLCVHCERNVANQCYVSALCKLTRFPHANTVDNSNVFLFSYIRIVMDSVFICKRHVSSHLKRYPEHTKHSADNSTHDRFGNAIAKESKYTSWILCTFTMPIIR